MDARTGDARTGARRFRDRREAGQVLAERLDELPERPEWPVVLALPRGGLPVADEVAMRLDAPIDVFVARKIGAPGHEELGIGVSGNDVVLVDDGLATGVTAEAALQSLRRQAPRRLVLAVPVCATETRRRLVDEGLVDTVVCVVSSDRMVAVGAWYDDFTQTTDDEVVDLLARARARQLPGQRRP